MAQLAGGRVPNWRDRNGNNRFGGATSGSWKVDEQRKDAALEDPKRMETRLAELLKDASSRQTIARVGPYAEQVLDVAMRDTAPKEHRLTALKILGKLGAEWAAPAEGILIHTTRDKDKDVAKAAEQTMKIIAASPHPPVVPSPRIPSRFRDRN